ncbi:MAG: DUF3488 and transglutaminase-like domain-containing protein [Pseudomonadota bacterium]
MSQAKGINTHPPMRVVFWTIAALSIAAAPHLLAMPIQLSITIVAVLAWRTASARWSWRPIPAWIRVIITLALLFLVAVSFGGLWGRRAATALLCVMLAAKMMEMYRVRDMRLVASVSFFLIATQFLFDESLIYLIYLLVGCWTSTMALTRIQQVRLEDHQFFDTGSEDRNLAKDSTQLLLMGLPLALTLFFLFPRLAQPLWGLPDDALDGKTGLSETMSPGSIANLYSDDSPAFRGEFASGRPPPPEDRYWRGPVLWDFNGTTWSPNFFSESTAPERVPLGDNAISYEVQMEPNERRWLLALDYPVSTDQSGALLLVDYQLVNENPITTLTAYNVISNPDFIDSPVLQSPLRLASMRLPEDRNPRTLEMASEWRQRYPDDLELANAVLRWFNEEPFFYSLETAPLGRHGADEFLFDLRTGYCEYYASAFAILMRGAGVPTRVVTGYQGGFWNVAGEYLLVRQSDAHAWNEIWIEGQGWIRVDPTAAVSPSRILEGSTSAIGGSRFFLDWPLVNNLRNRMDRLQHLWNQWVLGFDAEAQVRLLTRLGLPELRPTQIALLMLGVLLVIVLPLSLILLRELRRGESSLARKAWLRLQRKINRQLKLKQGPAETPREWVNRVTGALQQPSAELKQLLEDYERVHYGPYALEDQQAFLDLTRAFPISRLRRMSPAG